MKPMLGVAAPKDLVYPLYASVKIDGVRAVCKDGKVLSRKLIPIPNKFIQETLGGGVLDGLDGELAVGPAWSQGLMQTTMSGVMTHEGQPDFNFHVFDYWTQPKKPYDKRLQDLRHGFTKELQQRFPRIQIIDQHIVYNDFELEVLEAMVLEQGYEGLMVRAPDAPYKYGRSTAKEGYLLKLKRFVDGEAVVIGFVEQLHNANELTQDELGHAKRSKRKEGMVPAGTLGALQVRDLVTNIEFELSGFKDAEAQYIWDNRPDYIGKFAAYKHFNQSGVKVKPRIAVFKGFRDARDMS